MKFEIFSHQENHHCKTVPSKKIGCIFVTLNFDLVSLMLILSLINSSYHETEVNDDHDKRDVYRIVKTSIRTVNVTVKSVMFYFAQTGHFWFEPGADVTPGIQHVVLQN